MVERTGSSLPIWRRRRAERQRESISALQNNADDFRRALLEEIDYQRAYQDHCFSLAERLRFVASVLGLLAALSVALFAHWEYGQYLSALPALAAVCLSFERSFSLRARSGWHSRYRIGLQLILADFDQIHDLAQARKARIALDQARASDFPQGSDPSPSA